MHLQVNGQRIARLGKICLVAGSVNEYPVSFVFDPSWAALEKTAVFQSSGGVVREVALEHDACVIPWETLLPDTRLKIGVYGLGGGTRRPTVFSEAIPVLPGAREGEPAQAPTPTLYEQWVAQVSADRALAQTAAAQADRAADRAGQAAVHEPRLSPADTWLVWDPDGGDYRDTGLYGGGKAPEIREDGVWRVGGESTGVPATGPTGAPGVKGPQGERGENGPRGEAGPAGPAPVRGVDYWTEADVAAIQDFVDQAILGGVW